MFPAHVIEATLGVPAARLRVWAARYDLSRKREAGRMLYDIDDVTRILADTREERQRRLPAKHRRLV